MLRCVPDVRSLWASDGAEIPQQFQSRSQTKQSMSLFDGLSGIFVSLFSWPD
jgi:hypothetical protein